ncbi:MAG: hypothetical protein IPI64_08335 [Chloracidobacterium sp.]|nr:hypothetical protein [Chloracidobacterium sp.]
MLDEFPVPSTDAEWNEFIEAWIAGWPIADRTEAEKWAADAVTDWALEEKHEPVWEFITRAFGKEMPDTTFAILAAGPMEDLLSEFGPLYIDRVEELARTNPRFNELLGGVWRLSMTDEVWERVQKIRSIVW